MVRRRRRRQRRRGCCFITPCFIPHIRNNSGKRREERERIGGIHIGDAI